ncbi:hypothetical protein BDW59DRAFT_173026 [Aspergillus cavernicola]|uniref:Rhodopsin domain-containing protein n=1 Tax=Aspergillus cavernicola TaxID=176166 RepID=A0ABR4IAJ9_9EURO
MATTGMVTAVRAVTLTVAILCTSVCCVRLYMRRVVVKSFGLDDYLVILSLLLVNGFSAIAYTITYYGLGAHQADVSMEDLVVWLKIYYAALCSYLVVAAVVKLSLVTFIMRVFPTRYVKIIGYAIIASIIIFTISGELTLAFQCKPIRGFWDKTILSAKCFSADTLFALTMYQGVLMFIFDVAIIILPMPAIWKLQMPLKKRLLVLFVFSFGLVACVAALVRFTTLVYTKDTTDMTYSAAMSLIWMEIEFNFGLLAGSLSSIRQLFRIKSIFGSNNNRYAQDGSSSHPVSSGYDLSHGTSWRRGDGILKVSEVHTTVDEYHDHDGGRPESQERIVVPMSATGGTSAGIYGQGDSVRVDVSSTARY